MTALRSRLTLALGWALALSLPLAGHALAQSSLGIGVNDGGVPPSSGMLGHVMNWISVHQQQFYRTLTGALKEMRDGKGGTGWMIGLSFLYGVFHAAGPGHGKAVISSYMLANEVTLRRGILLSFLSALLQAATAILVMVLAFLVLRGTAITMTDATRFLEISSYGLITLFGAWLLWKKLAPRLAWHVSGRPAASLSAAATTSHQHSATCGHQFIRHEAAGRSSAGSQFAAEVCESCGHSHMPDPRAISGDRFTWKSAWSAVFAVGLRPCSGALIVLSFAFLNGLFAGGVVSVLAMALGTAITVSLLATLAVLAKGWAVAFAGGGRMGDRLHSVIEVGGALLVFLFGLSLLIASLRA